MPEVNNFKYVYSTKHIEEVLRKIQDAGRPDKITATYLRSTWLLKNAQYSAVIDLLKAMNFIDSAGTPLELYSEYQNSKIAKKALAKGTLNAYLTLFKAYPKAHSLSTEDLRDYFKQQTGAEKAVLQKLISTFKKLCNMSDFSEELSAENSSLGIELEKNIPTPVNSPQFSQIPITMNIQIVIPNDASDEQYDKIFSSIKKFLVS